MTDSAAILFANEAFYQAFTDQDFQAMDDIWASEAPIACIHPGWPALTSRDAVMESWRRIFGGGGFPGVTMHDAKVFQYGDCAVVICYETVGDEVLVATNVFVRGGENGTWLICQHQAGVTSLDPPASPTGPSANTVN